MAVFQIGRKGVLHVQVQEGYMENRVYLEGLDLQFEGAGVDLLTNPEWSKELMIQVVGQPARMERFCHKLDLPGTEECATCSTFFMFFRWSLRSRI